MCRFSWILPDGLRPARERPGCGGGRLDPEGRGSTSPSPTAAADVRRRHVPDARRRPGGRPVCEQRPRGDRSLAALVAPDRFDAGRLEAYLSTIAGNDKETRERRDLRAGRSGGSRRRRPAGDPGRGRRARASRSASACCSASERPPSATPTTARSIAAALVEDYGEAVGRSGPAAGRRLAPRTSPRQRP